jgi:hypothetical protein
MRIVIAGTTFWHIPTLAEAVMKRLVARYRERIVIVHGDEPGIEEAVARLQRMQIATETHPPALCGRDVEAGGWLSGRRW